MNETKIKRFVLRSFIPMVVDCRVYADDQGITIVHSGIKHIVLWNNIVGYNQTGYESEIHNLFGFQYWCIYDSAFRTIRFPCNFKLYSKESEYYRDKVIYGDQYIDDSFTNMHALQLMIKKKSNKYNPELKSWIEWRMWLPLTVTLALYAIVFYEYGNNDAIYMYLIVSCVLMFFVGFAWEKRARKIYWGSAYHRDIQ